MSKKPKKEPKTAQNIAPDLEQKNDLKTSQETTFENDTKGRNWLFTQNNPTMTDTEFYNYLEKLNHIRYFIFCREKAPKTGTIHFQGYFEFSQPKRFSTLCGYLPKTHIMPRGGSKKDNIDYVKKQGNHADKKDTQIGEVLWFGDPVEQGGRNDITEIKNDILDGLTPREIMFARNLNAGQLKVLDRLYAEHQAEKWETTQRPEIIGNRHYFYGDPETGKSRYLWDNYDPKDFYFVDDYNHPFDNYDYQKILVLDEFEGQFKATLLNRLLDRYPVQLSCRFKNKYAAWTKVYIISNKPITHWYQDQPQEIRNGFTRRIDHIKKFTNTQLLTQYDLLTPLSDDDADDLGF